MARAHANRARCVAANWRGRAAPAGHYRLRGETARPTRTDSAQARALCAEVDGLRSPRNGATLAGPLDIQALESDVEKIYRLARSRKRDAWPPSRLAVTILGPTAIALVPGQLQLGRLVGSQIRVRAGLPAAITQWVIGHELAHFVRGPSCAGPDEETACDYIAAAVQMRWHVFAARLREVGHDYRQLALDFGTTETSAALRIGEVTGRPIAVVLPARVYARGELASMPDDRVRTLAAAPWPGVRKVRITDARDERTALDATRLLRRA